MNTVKTGILLAGLTALFGTVGYLLGGAGGMAAALGLGAVTNLFALWNSDRLALRAHGAREVDERSAPDLVRMVAALAGRAGLPMPRVYVLDSAQPNAFATGRSPAKGAVAVSTGLLESLSRDEIAGVIAHELAHIRNRDTLIMTVSATVAGAVATLAQFGFLFGGRGGERPNALVMLGTALLAPVAAMIIQFAISRAREYDADRDGATICGDPLALASALERIEAGARRVVNVPAERHPATAPLFIVNPLAGRGIDSLFSTHPPTPKRVAALRAMASGPNSPASGSSPPAASGSWSGGARLSPWR